MSVTDFFVIIPIMFLIGIVVLVSGLIISTISSSTSVFTTEPEAAAAIASSNTALLTFDNLFTFILIGLATFVIISGYFVFNHPVFFILSFIMLCIAVIVSAIVSNSWLTFTSGATINAISLSYPKMQYIMLNLPKFISVFGIISLITMFIGYRQTQ